MKVVLIEDEYLSLIALQKMLEQYCPSLQIVGTATSIKKAIALIKKTKPDLAFMDIQLSDGLSFDIFEQIQHPKLKVVFLTAFNQYALKAFEHAAVHYLLKPISPQALQEVVIRLEEFKPKKYNLNDSMSVLEDILGNKTAQLKIATQKEVIFIDIDKILYCEADNNYTAFYVQERKKPIIASKPLVYFETHLPKEYFIRTHNKYLVNLTAVTEYIKGRGGDLRMQNNAIIPVSVRKKTTVLKELQQYLDPND
jgi:two-component system LytT family response regulator